MLRDMISFIFTLYYYNVVSEKRDSRNSSIIYPSIPYTNLESKDRTTERSHIILYE